MNTQSTNFLPVLSHCFMATFTRFLACIVLSLVILVPAKHAQAKSPVDEALDTVTTVCDKAPSLCGNFKGVADACFKGSDELGCAIAIIGVASGGLVPDAQKQLDAIVGCVKSKLPIKDACKTALNDAGMPADKINDAYGLIQRCSGIDDVDDAIVCADTLLDSSIAKDLELEVPTWINSLFDIYMDIRDKDYWGLVYDVGATIACAVANYFLGTDVCAFLEDLAEIAGEIVDGVKEGAGAVNNLGEKIFTSQTKHVPVVQYFQENWLPDVDNYARNIVVKKNGGYWDANVGAKYTACQSYFTNHTMSDDKANRACNDMRDGTNVSDNSFIDKGFSQLASRRGAVLLLPAMIPPAAKARVELLRSQGAFKPLPLASELQPYDPWKALAEAPGLDNVILAQYGITGTQQNHEANTAEEAWPAKSVGHRAYLQAQVEKVATATLNFPTSDAIAKKSLATAEAAINFADVVKNTLQTAQTARVKSAETTKKISEGIQESQLKPLNDLIALCKPKAMWNCETEVRDRYAVCDKNTAAFRDSNASAIANFDSSQGRAAIKKAQDMQTSCEADIRQFVTALPNGAKGPLTSCKEYLGRDNELLCNDVAGYNECKAQADAGKFKSCRQAGTQNVYPDSAAAANDATLLKLCKPFLGRPDELLCTQPAAFNVCKKMVDSGKMKTCRLADSTEAYPASVAAAGALSRCDKFLGRADELLCSEQAGFDACKAQVDSGKMKTCRLANTQQRYEKASAAQPTLKPTPTPLNGSGSQLGGTALAAAAANAKVNTEALKSCKSFLGRADELLCNDTAGFNACKTQVDSGKLKTCRQTGNTQAYSKSSLR